jgi:membrane fusion protein
MTLFREEVLLAKRESPLGKVLLLRPLAFSLFAAAAVVLAAMVIAVLCFGHYTKRIQVSGVLLPQKGLIKLTSPQPGIVLERRVSEQQHVKAGDVLFIVSSKRFASLDETRPGDVDTDVNLSIVKSVENRQEILKSTREKQTKLASQQRGQLASQVESYRAELHQLDAEITAQSKRFESMQQLFERFKNLHEKHFVSDFDFEQKRGDLLEQETRLQAMQRDRIGILRQIETTNSDLEQNTTRSEKELTQIDTQLSELHETSISAHAQSGILLRAPQDGTVTTIMADAGQQVGNQTLLTILPDGSDLIAQLFAPSRAIGFIEVGQPVNIRFQSYPFQKFGQYKGVVSDISHAPMGQQEIPVQLGPSAALANDRESVYRIDVKLDSQSVVAYGKKQPLVAGMTMDADILQDTRTLLEWIFEPLFSLQSRQS